MIDTIGREHRVLVMGPALFLALLRTIHLVFVTLALEDKADEIRDLLGVTRVEMQKMGEVLERLSRQAGAFSGTIERAHLRTWVIGGRLREPGASAGTAAIQDSVVPGLETLGTGALGDDPGGGR